MVIQDGTYTTTHDSVILNKVNAVSRSEGSPLAGAELIEAAVKTIPQNEEILRSAYAPFF